MSALQSMPGGAGIGLRLPHLSGFAAFRPRIPWVEIHPENFLANPHATEILLALRRDYPVSVHTVGLSIGSAGGVDRDHLAAIGAFVAAVEPFQLSGHLAWSTHEGEYLNDLLPLPYDDDSLALLVREVDVIQSVLGRQYVVENPSSYLGFSGSTMTEMEFLAELAARSGCGLLCDVSNVHVSGVNMGYDPAGYIEAFPAGAVRELHLGGFTEEEDAGAPLLIDTHDQPVAEAAWHLYERALRRFGPVPTLIEWDSALPTVEVLVSEAARADAIAARQLREDRDAAA